MQICPYKYENKFNNLPAKIDFVLSDIFFSLKWFASKYCSLPSMFMMVAVKSDSCRTMPTKNGNKIEIRKGNKKRNKKRRKEGNVSLRKEERKKKEGRKRE